MLLFIDGMAHYATDEIDKKYTVQDDTACTWSIAAEGRYANALKKVITATGTPGYVEVFPLMTQSGPWTPTASGVIGFAFKCDDLDRVFSSFQGDASSRNIFSMYEGGGWVLAVTLNANGTFSFFRHQEAAFGVGSIYLGSSIQGVRSGAWAYVEFKWLIHDTAGYIESRVNEVRTFRFDGDTSASSFSYGFTNVWTGVRLMQLGAGTLGLYPTFWMGDVVLADLVGAGDQIRDYSGDVTIDMILPDGVGAASGWTPLAGANWTNVEETPPDEDTSYVSVATPTTRDSYTMNNLPAGTVPLGFQTLLYAKKLTPGVANLQPTFRQAGVTYDGNTQGISIPDDYRYIIQPYDTNPATGVRITEAEVNASEFGVEKVN